MNTLQLTNQNDAINQQLDQTLLEYRQMMIQLKWSATLNREEQISLVHFEHLLQIQERMKLKTVDDAWKLNGEKEFPARALAGKKAIERRDAMLKEIAQN